MRALVSRDALSSEELGGTVPDGEVRNSVDELSEGETMVRITDREHTQCVRGGFEPNFGEAGRGAIVRREAVPAATGKLKGESQINWKERHVFRLPCLGISPVPRLKRRKENQASMRRFLDWWTSRKGRLKSRKF